MDKFSSINTHTYSKQITCSCISLVLNNNYFTYQSNIYQRHKGTIIFSNLFLVTWQRPLDCNISLHIQLHLVTYFSNLVYVSLHIQLHLVTYFSNLVCVSLHIQRHLVTYFSNLVYVSLHIQLHLVTYFSNLVYISLHIQLHLVT